MKKALYILLLTLSLLIAGEVGSSAQIGISASFVNNGLKGEEGSISGSNYSGFQGMLSYNLTFARILGINFGGGYAYLRRKEDPKVVNGSAAECYSQEQLIRVPLHITINIPIKNGFGFLIYGGGAVSWALQGINAIKVSFPEGQALLTYDYYTTSESRQNITDAQYAQASPYLDKSPAMKRYDAQAEAGIGIRLNSFIMVRGGYSYGLVNHYKSDAQGYARRNQITAGLTLLF